MDWGHGESEPHRPIIILQPRVTAVTHWSCGDLSQFTPTSFYTIIQFYSQEAESGHSLAFRVYNLFGFTPRRAVSSCYVAPGVTLDLFAL